MCESVHFFLLGFTHWLNFLLSYSVLIVYLNTLKHIS